MNPFPAIITTTQTSTEGDTTNILDHQHQNQKQQQQQQIDEICDLFSTTVHSLGEDAIAIRQISSLAEICGIKNTSAIAAAAASNNNSSNNNNNAAAVASDEIINWDDPNLQQLIEIDNLVTKIEDKVNALRSIVSEEKIALDKFETTLQQEANLQSIVVEQMTDAMIQQLHIDVLQERSTTTAATAQSNNNNNNNNISINRTTKKYNSKKTKPSSFGGGRKRRDSVDPRSKMMTMNNRRTPFSSSFDDEDYYDDDDDDDDEEEEQSQHYQEEAISLERVTLSELRQIPRQTLGRISLMDLNEALQEIEKVCDNRIKVIMPNTIIKNKKRNQYNNYYGSYSAASPSSSSNNNNTLQRRLDYLKQHRSTNNSVDIEVEAHAGHLWVSEQELRENCAFFRHGEATARATLSILCALKRLKQVPGKNSEITYILSSPPHQQQQQQQQQQT